MIPLIGSSILLLVFVFERAISLRRGRVIPGPFVKRFMHQLREGKLDRDSALDLCQESQTAVSDVFAGAVKKWGRPSVEVEQAVLDAGERAANTLRHYLRLFNAIATVGPLLGLLGTVFGMIRIFHDVAASSAMGRAEMLAGGISEAMLTTATGLSVAIPALCFYTFFQSRVDKLVVELDGLGQQIVGLVSAEALQEDRTRATRAARRGTAAA
jgi:biopolymer transport protein ExbB